uniref:Nitric oxide synthase n=2 Tax=Cacopsylla melanoneura TaxID=428564 RepID=A0A8D8YWA0_9HEMI
MSVQSSLVASCPVVVSNHVNHLVTVNAVVEHNKSTSNSTAAPIKSNGMGVSGGLLPAAGGGLGAPQPESRKPLRLKNVASHVESFDMLHHKAIQPNPLKCSSIACTGSVMAITPSSGVPRTPEQILPLAKDFLDQYFASIKRSDSPAHLARWEQVQKEVTQTGTYELTETELVFGAKLAWRNSARCIGRIQWSKLQVFDCRSVTTTSNMFEAICNHIKYATNKGNIRSAITVFKQRTDDKHDFRVWNNQLIAYAGYKGPDGTITGDPAYVEFTEVCMKLGWKGKGTQFDILPLVLSANGHDPEYFDIPQELVWEVEIEHPTYEWFKDLGLRWYAVPAVSGMMFDCGGLQFTGAPFNGWYMSTEIGSRDLCDAKRYNISEIVAKKMDLDTGSNVTLWKDKVNVEVNIAVLHSFQIRNTTIVDHHSASEQFMKHYENEQRLRNGCPADWVWITPPMSSSMTPVFHQEMAVYSLQPSYEYQEPAWKTHVMKKGRDSTGKNKKSHRKFHFKQIARAVKFTSKLFGRALSRRIKATVLYATETGKSELYAKKLGELFGHAFHSQVVRMDEYDMSSIEHEALILVVASTFGNGDPPENGQEFAQNLHALKIGEDSGSLNTTIGSASFIKANSQSDAISDEKNDPNKKSTAYNLETTFGPLSNVRFAVFALGSSAYPNFAAFGSYVDNILGELGGERLVKLRSGDEMCGQEQAFRSWAPEVFNVACETFCLDDDDTLSDATQVISSVTLNASTVRFQPMTTADPLPTALAKVHSRKVWQCPLIKKWNLYGAHQPVTRTTLGIQMRKQVGCAYEPGDHVGIFAANKPDLVSGILGRLNLTDVDPDEPMELQVLSETHTSTEVIKAWKPHERLPRASLRTLLSRYLDITTPPPPALLQFFATYATAPEDQEILTLLATDSAAYEDWRHWRFPHLLEVLEQFPSIHLPPALLVAQLTPLQPRFYSISSSPLAHPNEIHLTVAVVSYRTQDGNGSMHYGVCSNYLLDANDDEEICLFVRSAPNFHLPKEEAKGIICVGPGTGIAPFRGFWEHRYAKKKQDNRVIKFDIQEREKMSLFFGCQLKAMDLYSEEKTKMLEEKVLTHSFLALSRELSIPKTYVQDLMKQEAGMVYRVLIKEGGHFYVCGDCTMAEDVYQTLKIVFQMEGNLTEPEADKLLLRLRDENRYHEDIFGITLRTAEVHKSSRESARIRMQTSGP